MAAQRSHITVRGFHACRAETSPTDGDSHRRIGNSYRNVSIQRSVYQRVCFISRPSFAKTPTQTQPKLQHSFKIFDLMYGVFYLSLYIQYAPHWGQVRLRNSYKYWCSIIFWFFIFSVWHGLQSKLRAIPTVIDRSVHRAYRSMRVRVGCLVEAGVQP